MNGGAEQGARPSGGCALSALVLGWGGRAFLGDAGPRRSAGDSSRSLEPDELPALEHMMKLSPLIGRMVRAFHQLKASNPATSSARHLGAYAVEAAARKEAQGQLDRPNMAVLTVLERLGHDGERFPL